ncbi:MAG: MFS transporter [Salaquimonas sp.]|nr:MFS transporter [Salaquimonas sp.]
MLNRIFVPGTAAPVGGLAITMTVGYGSMFYSFSILADQFVTAFGWSRSFVFAVFSVGLLASGLVAPAVGNLLDRVGARRPMTIGSLLAGLALISVGLTQGRVSFTAASLLVTLVSALVFYEAAFVAMTQVAGERARLGITQITLVAGFAQTIFWPLVVFLLKYLDWREVYFVLGAMQFAICAPIHWLVLPRGVPVHAAADVGAAADQGTRLRGPVPPGTMVLLGICFCGGAVAITATQLHLPEILNGLGYSISAAAAIGALVGPFQVSARVVEMGFGARRTPMTTGLASTGLLTAGLAFLLFAGLSAKAAIAFAVCYGAGQGLTYIVRGAVPLFLFGPVGYGRITGKLNSLRLILSATAPFGFAWIAETWGQRAAIALLVASAAISLGALFILFRRIVAASQYQRGMPAA